MEVKLDAANFAAEILKSETPSLVDFWADWCTPCHAIAPAISEIAKAYEGKLKVGKLNVDENPQIAQTYNVRSIPNLKIFKNGQVVGDIVGAVPKTEIVKQIQKHL